jgi:DNA-binding LacI/PurR family transcriptional regulator
VPDNISGGYLAIEHLVQLGHRRIAVLCGPAKYKTLTDRLNGALLAARDAGLVPDQFYVQPSLSSGRPKKGVLELQAVLESGFAPTAVFAVSDKTAFGAYEAAQGAGLRIPDDLSIIGFDDLANSLHAEPPLTTIRIPKREFGIVALQNLVNQLNDNPVVPTKVLIYTSLLVRESTAPPKDAYLTLETGGEGRNSIHAHNGSTQNSGTENGALPAPG